MMYFQIGESQDHITFWSAVEAVMPVIEFIGAIPLASKYENKEQLVHVLVQHLVVKRIQDVLAQFIEGFECLGCFKEVTSNPKTTKQLFVCDNSVILNSVMVDELFKVNFSQEGSNHYILELKTHTYWRDFVQDLEEEPEGLQNLLTFITGYDTVPPLGFDPPLSLHFIHTENDSDDDAVPYANTCANMLQIPVLSSFDVFQERMHLAVKLGTTFTNQ
ncbi:G2/M phase-specific E3 ubiquitin-protein ligase-like [Mytilus trossulus]|uniref:G2/M phase-specific E3 ubiquitin-protein ligase-like n=1 Tax=Mytilus trossulus TaxID=6551 RepID=UPI0030040012